MGKRYEITNLSNSVQTFEGHVVQPRTRRVLNLDEQYQEHNIERWRSRGVFMQETQKDAENGRPLPKSDPELVEAYARLTTAEGADRDKVLADLGLVAAPKAPTKKADG